MIASIGLLIASLNGLYRTHAWLHDGMPVDSFSLAPILSAFSYLQWAVGLVVLAILCFGFAFALSKRGELPNSNPYRSETNVLVAPKA